MPRKKNNAWILTTTVYLDSDVIVAAEIDNEQNHTESQKFMDFILKQEHRDIIFITSVFTFLELASAMIRRTNDEHRAYSLLYRIRNVWKGSIKPVPPMPPKKLTSFTTLVDRLAETSIKFHTPSGDTIHAQTAAWHEVDYLVTWNKKHYLYMEKQLEDLRVLTPTEAIDEFNKYKKNKKVR